MGQFVSRHVQEFRQRKLILRGEHVMSVNSARPEGNLIGSRDVADPLHRAIPCSQRQTTKSESYELRKRRTHAPLVWKGGWILPKQYAEVLGRGSVSKGYGTQYRQRGITS